MGDVLNHAGRESGNAFQPAEDAWLTVRQAARYMQCGPKTVYSLASSGRLRAARIGGKRALRIKRRWCDESLEASAAVIEVRS